MFLSQLYINRNLMSQPPSMDTEKAIPRVDLLPMAQRSQIKDRSEDWTGKTSTAERRKLQNRLNQRAARKRKALTQRPFLMSSETIQQDDNVDAWRLLTDSEFPGYILELIKRPDKGEKAVLCMSHYARKMVVAAPSFANFLPTPLPSDQKLLTLLHFNLVRAFGQLVYLLGYTVDDMSLEIFSRFSPTEKDVCLDNLPSTLRPTQLQRSVVHYAEVDVFPYPEYRDNCILAEGKIDDVELCNDILYGVESEREKDGWGLDISGRTGLIVWSDPWRKESWEIDEKFARKYAGLFKGCQELIESTNHWRASRGERPLCLRF